MPVSMSVLRRDCGFSESDFAEFRCSISLRLQKPENRIGFQGPRRLLRKGPEAWEIWLDEFIDNGIGEFYWGLGTTRAWSFPANRAKIRYFMRTAVMTFSAMVRKECGNAPPSSENAIEIPQLKQSHLLGSVGTPPTTVLVDDDSRKPKRRKYGSPTVIDISSESELNIITVSSDPPTPTPFNRALEAEMTESVSSLKQNRLDLVLETTITGSSEIRLIYCANTYPQSCFMREVRRKHGLGHEHEILGIRVKTGDKVFNVDLEESRDWGYISGVITKNGGRAEMTVSIK